VVVIVAVVLAHGPVVISVVVVVGFWIGVMQVVAGVVL